MSTINDHDVAWRFGDDGATEGPYSVSELRQHVSNGRIRPETELVHENGHRTNARGLGLFPQLEETAAISATGQSTSEHPVSHAPRPVQPPPPPPPPDASGVSSGFPTSQHPQASPSPRASVSRDESLESKIDARRESWRRLTKVADAQRTMNWVALAGVGLNSGIGAVTDEVIRNILHPLFLIGMTVSLVVTIANLGVALNRNAWLYRLLGVVPGLNLLAILYLNRKATEMLSAAGISVGFLGTQLPKSPPETFNPR